MRGLVGVTVVAAAVLAGGAAFATGKPGGAAYFQEMAPSPSPSGYGSAPRPGNDEPRSALTLSYLADAGFAAAVKMTCEPTGGAHPEAEAVCTILDRFGADPSKITPTLNACVLVYAPVTAEVTGVWRGAPIAWKKRYGNVCEMRRATGPLFQF